MWDEKSVFPKIEIGFVFKPHMNYIYLEAFNNQTFNQYGNESATLRINYYNPPYLVFQHLPVKEKFKKKKLIRREMDIILILQLVLILVKILKQVGE